MSIDYSIACKQCKVTRDLDTFYSSSLDTPKNRREALVYSEKLNSFRVGLLASFVADHIGHECVFFHEHTECAESLDSDYESSDYTADVDFWNE